jgi:hypothetical protein
MKAGGKDAVKAILAYFQLTMFKLFKLYKPNKAPTSLINF